LVGADLGIGPADRGPDYAPSSGIGCLAGSTLVTLDATGHCPQLSAPKATLNAIEPFLSAYR
jgi:pimeloyl-ACP methyl ester carboxylesterase